MTFPHSQQASVRNHTHTRDRTRELKQRRNRPVHVILAFSKDAQRRQKKEDGGGREGHAHNVRPTHKQTQADEGGRSAAGHQSTAPCPPQKRLSQRGRQGTGTCALLRRRSSSGFFPSAALGAHMDSPLSRSPGRKELSED